MAKRFDPGEDKQWRNNLYMWSSMINFKSVKLLTVGGGNVLSFFYRWRHKKGRTEVLWRQALKRKGELKDNFLMPAPKFFFNHSGYDVSVASRYPKTRRGPSTTVAESSLRLSESVELELCRKGGIEELDRLSSMQHRQTGNPKFDKAFLLKANDESFVHKLLTPEVLEKLLGLNDPHMQITRDGLRLVIRGIPFDTYSYDKFLDTVVLLLENIKNLEDARLSKSNGL
jgi:hypothetical protein